MRRQLVFLISAFSCWAVVVSAADVERALAGVVEIRSKTADGVVLGTGFVIEPTGIVVTCYHVIDGALDLAVRLHSGETYSDIRVLAFDQTRDIALIKVAGYALPTIPLGDSDAVRVGDAVLAIGHPKGLDDTVTKGIVSAIRTVEGVKVLQTDSAASPGNSGGPLLNDKGECVGVLSFKVSGEALNFAIPVNYVRGLLGMQNPITLAQFSAARKTDATSLFTSESDSVSGRWRSLESNTIKVFRVDGEYVTGESLTRDERTSLGNFDLKKQADGTYSGRYKPQAVTCKYWCQWSCFSPHWEENSCQGQYETVLTKVEKNRIEGYIIAPKVPAPSDRSFAGFCKTCGASAPKVKQSFVWVRIEQ